MPLKLGILRAGARLGTSLAPPEYFPTGCPEVDDLLGGGFVRGELTEVFGAPASGRTNLALCVSARVLVRGLSVLYVDCDGGVVRSRMRELVAAAWREEHDCRLAGAPSQAREEEHDARVGAALSSFLCCRVCGWDELACGVANTVEDAVRARSDVGLLVVDTLALPYRSCEWQSAPKRLEALASRLAGLAMTRNVAVVVVNNARGMQSLSTAQQHSSDYAPYPFRVAREVGFAAMGEAWAYISPCRVAVGWNSRRKRVLHVVKSSRVPSGFVTFLVTDVGIEADDWA